MTYTISMNIYTLGYEGFTLENFVSRLHILGVRRVVDVRDIPVSRKKGFSKRALSETLQESGIAYTHIKRLGCPKPIRDRLKQDGNWPLYAKNYAGYLASQPQALAELAQLAQKSGPVSLLCFEADFRRCHRSLIAKAIVESCPNLRVVHATAKTTWPELVIRVAA
jgi:uncharacterized protein (DUF488 family)